MSTSIPLTSTSKKGGKLNIALWIAQLLVAALFIFAGAMKVLKPIPELATMWPWMGQVPPWVVRVTGVIDLAGAFGIILPSLTRIMPKTTVLAAFGCTLLQICALVFHASRGEYPALPVNAVLILLSIFILWGRSKRAPIQPR